MATPSVPRARKLVVAMKAEATYGTDVFAGTYLAADVIPCFNVQPRINIEEIPNRSMAGDIGRLPSPLGVETASISFSMFYRGRTVAFDDSPSRIVPESDLPFRGCGLAAVFSVANGAAFDKVTWAPSSTPESMTIYVAQEISGQANAPTLKIVGAYGTVDITVRAGGVLELRFTFTGKMAGRADVAYVAGTISTTPQYPVLKSATLTYDAISTFRIGAVGFSLGNIVSPLPSVNDAAGVAGFFISDRNPRFTIDPEADRIAIYDWYTKWKNGNAASLSFVLGATQWNKLTVTAPKVQPVIQDYAERDGLTAWPTTLMATLQAGNDDLSLEAS